MALLVQLYDNHVGIMIYGHIQKHSTHSILDDHHQTSRAEGHQTVKVDKTGFSLRLIVCVCV